MVEHQRGSQTREVGVGGAEKEEGRKASQSHYQARKIEPILYGRDKRHSIRGDFFCGRRIRDRVEATRRDMVDLLYGFAKRPLGASPLLRKIAASISARAARSRASFACTTASWHLINALFIPPPLIWTSPRRQRGIQLLVQSSRPLDILHVKKPRQKPRFCEIWALKTVRNRWENKNEQWWALIIPRSLKLTPGKRAHRA